MREDHVMIFTKTPTEQKLETLEAELAAKDAQLAEQAQLLADLTEIVLLGGGA